MNLPITGIIIIVLVFGFLTGSTVFFYNKSHVPTKTVAGKTVFDAELPTSVDANTPTEVDSLTKPAEPKGRPSYPKHVYVVQPKETLAAISSKFHIPWTLIVAANGLRDANLIQSGFPLVIPKLNKNTDYYRVEFVLNEDKLTAMNRELREAEQSEYFDPTTVAKKNAPPYFAVREEDGFSLIEKDLSNGTALVEAKGADYTNVIGLIQPKIKGERGIWTILYVERHDK